MGNYWRFESNPFWHHEWKDFDAEAFVRTIKGLIASAIALQIGLASFFLMGQVSPFWAGTNLFLVAMIFHFIALNYIDRRVPRRSFVDDAQRGSLDFLRLLPVSGHELVIARKLPLWFLIPKSLRWFGWRKQLRGVSSQFLSLYSVVGSLLCPFQSWTSPSFMSGFSSPLRMHSPLPLPAVWFFAG